MHAAEQLGKALGAALGTGPSRSTLSSQRQVVIDAMRRASHRSAPRPISLRFAFAGATALVAAALAVWIYSSGRELRAIYQGRELQEQAHVRASAGSEETLSFSDGSRLVLNQRAEITVSRLSRERAQVLLNRGSVSARISKGTGRSWAIDAGPYSVRVVGTEFGVDWNGEQEELAVTVTEGRVLVLGGGLPSAGVMLSAGGRLVRRGRAPEPALPAASTLVAAPRSPQVESGAERSEPLVSAVEPPWQSAAKAGSYAEALRIAERAGFERLVRTLPEKDLLLLANSARYAGSLTRARQALVGLRGRFAQGEGAPVAALMLAGLAEDHAKNPDEAATWLRAFLKESPHGELSAGARARLLAILVRRGDQSEAARVATDYLRYHPQGPYASKARAVLGTAAPP